jgi:hypothetical protein
VNHSQRTSSFDTSTTLPRLEACWRVDERSIKHPNAPREALGSKSQLDDPAGLAARPHQVTTLKALEGLANPVTVCVQGSFSDGPNIAGLECVGLTHADEVHCKLMLDRTLRTTAGPLEDWVVTDEVGNVLKGCAVHSVKSVSAHYLCMSMKRPCLPQPAFEPLLRAFLCQRLEKLIGTRCDVGTPWSFVKVAPSPSFMVSECAEDERLKFSFRIVIGRMQR